MILKQSTNRGKRSKKSIGESKTDGNTKEVVHVRAQRGQATDSHSIAERVCVLLFSLSIKYCWNGTSMNYSH